MRTQESVWHQNNYYAVGLLVDPLIHRRDAGKRERLFRFELATGLNGQRQDTEGHG